MTEQDNGIITVTWKGIPEARDGYDIRETTTNKSATLSEPVWRFQNAT